VQNKQSDLYQLIILKASFLFTLSNSGKAGRESYGDIPGGMQPDTMHGITKFFHWIMMKAAFAGIAVPAI